MRVRVAAPRSLSLSSIGVAFLIGILALPAAAAQRTFVHSSPIGADANASLVPPCALATPCRTFNVAIGVTDPAGEVVILDTAGYGPMVINKSIKVIGPSGVYGGISVLGGGSSPVITTGIVINAGDTDDVTLRGLDITGVASVAPLPLTGIDIQNAGAVHIEKSSVSNFPQDGGACIRLATSKTVRLYVVDSFLRHCLTGIYASGNAVSPNSSGLFVDNTRIERGFNANPASPPIGLWVQGFMGATLRNTMISRHTTAVQFDSNLANANNSLDVINSELTQNTNGLYYSGTAGNGTSTFRVVGSQITNTTNDAINIANSAAGRNTFFTIGSSVIGAAARLVALANSATDTVNARVVLEMDNTRAVNISGSVSIDLNSPNGAKTSALMRDSTFAQGGTVIKTRGAAQVSATLVRSQVNNCAIVVDHGVGTVRLQDNHIVACSDDFVNNGSSNIVSNGGNMVYDVPNASGFTYITPTVITLK